MTRSLNFAELLEQSLNEKLYTGKRVKGIVTNVAPNELHVDVGAKQAGIVPASEISDEAVNLMEMFHKDDEIDLIVLKVNDQEGIVTLSKSAATRKPDMTQSGKRMKTAPFWKAL